MEAFEEVSDSLCVPQHNQDGEERVVLFLRMAAGHAFRPALVQRVRDAIRSGLSARHVPSVILETKGIPVRPAPTGLPPTPAPLPPGGGRLRTGTSHGPTRLGTHREAGSGFIYRLSLLPGNKSFSPATPPFFNPS